ncbi:uncharacterized protein B0H64DRAFT_195959 [Chaetomium fimeti]|uniref:Secreted protein n=1 Tax=Chaetomium fimeti TaxID=1854472 RepID=A0AAE0HEI0_9PEZI|nr:hypothetical protein B0H64DRAFT_195959 [Chaetomium fimeti]
MTRYQQFSGLWWLLTTTAVAYHDSLRPGSASASCKTAASFLTNSLPARPKACWLAWRYRTHVDHLPHFSGRGGQCSNSARFDQCNRPSPRQLARADTRRGLVTGRLLAVPRAVEPEATEALPTPPYRLLATM